MFQDRLPLICAVLAGFLTQGFAGARAQEAPFSLSWGPVLSVPRPSMAGRDANITRLIYRDERLPAGLNDTAAVVLEVCGREGLQQVVWIGQPLPEYQSESRYEAALAEGTRRYGEPVPDPSGEGVTWPGGRTLLKRETDQAGVVHLVMASFGPDFEACSEHHRSLMGHPATDHASHAVLSPE